MPPDEVGPLNLYRGVVRVIVDGALEVYEAQSGVLIIAEATPTSLKGTFEFDGGAHQSLLRSGARHHRGDGHLHRGAGTGAPLP